MKYEMVTVWQDDMQKEITVFDTEEQARERAEGMKKAFGSQVWTCVRPRVEKPDKYVIMRETWNGYETVYNPNGKKDGYVFVFEAHTKEHALKLFFDSELIPTSEQGNYIAVKADEKPADDFDELYPPRPIEL